MKVVKFIVLHQIKGTNCVRPDLMNVEKGKNYNLKSVCFVPLFLAS